MTVVWRLSVDRVEFHQAPMSFFSMVEMMSVLLVGTLRSFIHLETVMWFFANEKRSLLALFQLPILCSQLVLS